MFFAVDSGEGSDVVEGLIDFLAVDVVEVGGWVAGGGMEDAVNPAHEVFVEGSGDADVVRTGVVESAGFGADVPCFGVVEVFGEDEDATGGALPGVAFVAWEACPVAFVVGECAAVEDAVGGDVGGVAVAEGAGAPFFDEVVFEVVEVHGVILLGWG